MVITDCPSTHPYPIGISGLDPVQLLETRGWAPNRGEMGTNDLLLWDRGCLQQTHSKYPEKGTA